MLTLQPGSSCTVAPRARGGGGHAVLPCRGQQLLEGCGGAGRRRRGRGGCALQAAVEAAPAASAAAQAVKVELLQALEGADRGIFGVTAAKKAAIHDLVSALEALTPVAAPIENLPMCAGSWELLYSTISITGVKRTKLGLREFIRLGTMLQDIDLERRQSVNVVQFSVSGLSLFQGSLTIRAGFEPVSASRVSISFQKATLEPPQLQKMFEKNYNLLLSVFNPQGHLDVTYLDDSHRVGRDDKGNLFMLRRVV